MRPYITARAIVPPFSSQSTGLRFGNSDLKHTVPSPALVVLLNGLIMTFWFSFKLKCTLSRAWQAAPSLSLPNLHFVTVGAAMSLSSTCKGRVVNGRVTLGKHSCAW